LRAGLRAVSDSLPPHTVFGPVAGASRRARLANRALRQRAKHNRQLFASIWDVDHPSKIRERLAADRFHPNDLGYSLMAGVMTDTLAGPTNGNSQES
jgi:hypothetical protein